MGVLCLTIELIYSTGSAAAVEGLAATLVLFTSVAALALEEEQSFLPADASAPCIAAQHAFLSLFEHFFSILGEASVVVVALCAIDTETPITSIAAEVKRNFFMRE